MPKGLYPSNLLRHIEVELLVAAAPSEMSSQAFMSVTFAEKEFSDLVKLYNTHRNQRTADNPLEM